MCRPLQAQLQSTLLRWCTQASGCSSHAGLGAEARKTEPYVGARLRGEGSAGLHMVP